MRCLMAAITLAAFLILLSPRETLAETRVRVYIAGGIIIGGVSIFWTITLGGGDFSKKHKENNEPSTMFALNEVQKQPSEDELSQAGMLKILEW